MHPTKICYRYHYGITYNKETTAVKLIFNFFFEMGSKAPASCIGPCTQPFIKNLRVYIVY
jgi:hypothetical protein